MTLPPVTARANTPRNLTEPIQQPHDSLRARQLRSESIVDRAREARLRKATSAGFQLPRKSEAGYVGTHTAGSTAAIRTTVPLCMSAPTDSAWHPAIPVVAITRTMPTVRIAFTAV